MLESVLPYMRCPGCASTRLTLRAEGMGCQSCEAWYPLREGILDFIGEAPDEIITPFQRIMQASVVVAIYERLWRPVGYYIASSRCFSDEIRTVLKLLRAADRCRILDLACGTGVFTRPLAQLATGLVVGFDLSWPMLRRARALAELEGHRNILFMRGTVFRLPFIGGAFPSISCCGALHLFDRSDLALGEIERVLGSEGHLAIQTTIRPSHSMGVAYILEKLIRFGFFDERELIERLRLHRLKILERERHRISYTLLARHATFGV